MNKRMAFMTVLIFVLGLVLASCAGMQTPATSGFKAPVVTLESFEVPQYDGYWYYGAKEKPAQGKPGAHGAPLPMSFLFSINNPNPYPIELNDMQFTVAFDKEFDVVTVNLQDSYWIPANKTDHVRATTMITVQSGLLSLLVTGGFKLKEKKWTAWQALERWWTGIPEYTVPVSVKEGSATFTADGQTKVAAFQGEVK